MIEFLAQALSQLRPNEGLIYNSGEPIDASKIIYDSESTQKITQTELDNKLNELSVEFENNQYQRDRTYPNIGDQLDMIYWDKINGTEKWKEAIEKVKADHPKPIDLESLEKEDEKDD